MHNPRYNLNWFNTIERGIIELLYNAGDNGLDLDSGDFSVIGLPIDSSDVNDMVKYHMVEPVSPNHYRLTTFGKIFSKQHKPRF